MANKHPNTSEIVRYKKQEVNQKNRRYSQYLEDFNYWMTLLVILFQKLKSVVKQVSAKLFI